jgi:glycosyltransferase involved in cell wall biosynthesis
MLVSFIIAAFNEENHIEAAVASCFNQSYKDIEVVVVDDCSLDATWTKLSDLQTNYKRLLIHRFDLNRGKVAAFNQAFKMSSGEFIAILCGDDISVPDRIEFCLENIGQYELIFGDLRMFDDASGSIIAESLMEKNLGINSDKLIDFNTLLENPMAYGSTIFSKREALCTVFPIDEDIGHEDWWIPLCLASHKEVLYCHRVLGNYRVHSSQSTALRNRFSSYVKWRTFRTREIPYYEKVLSTFDLDDRLKKIVQNRMNREKLAAERMMTRLRALLSLDCRKLLDYIMVIHPYFCYLWMKHKLF